ncbi:outer membrane porin, OprD family, partial [Pseudomonas chlororaphis subsp. aurantiaca]|nr:outer membrane porin, OprD family [Pseudomonas chlororaphis subsp. aurantiaca]
MKPSNTALLALAISSITAMAHAESVSQEFVPTTLAGTNAQSEAKGFIDGQSLGGTTRNWYANELKRRDDTFSYKKNSVKNDPTAPKTPT